MNKENMFGSAAVKLKKNKRIIKALSCAVLASIVGFNPNLAGAEAVDISQKPANVPTLDYLQGNNIVIPGEFKTASAEDSVIVNHYFIKDNDGNIHTAYRIYHSYGEKFSAEKYKDLLNSGKMIKYIRSNDLFFTLNELGVETPEEAIAKLEERSSDSYISFENPRIAYDEYLNKLPSSAFSAPISDYSSAYTVTKVDNEAQSTFSYKTFNEDGSLSVDYYKIDLKSEIAEPQNVDGTIIGAFIGKSERPVINYGGTIYNIVGDFINNTSGAISHSYTWKNDGYIGNITGSFINNTSGRGAAISSTRRSSIDNITGDFIGNTAIVENINDPHALILNPDSADVALYARGGAIYSGSQHKNITGNFINNKASMEGGALYIGGDVVGDIKGNFVDNSTEAYGEQVWLVSGGAITFGGDYEFYGASVAVLPETIEGNFIENSATTDKTASGGAIADYSPYNYINIENSNFINNKAVSTDNDAMGGALNLSYKYNEKPVYVKKVDVATLKNSKFIGNHADGKTSAKGGAVYSVQDLNIIADNGISRFTDNYITIDGKPENQAIYMDYNKEIHPTLKYINQMISWNVSHDNSAPTLSLIAQNNGKIIIDDKISGVYTYGNLKYQKPAWNQWEFLDRNNSVTGRLRVDNDSEHDASLLNLIDKNGNVVNTIMRYKGITKWTYYNGKYGNFTTYQIFDEDYNEIDTFISEENELLLTGYVPLEDYEFSDVYRLVIDGDSTGQVYINDKVDARDSDNNLKPIDISLANTNLFLGRDNVFDGNHLVLNSGFLSMINNQVGVSALKSMTVNGNTNFAADVDLLNQEMDRFTADSYGSHQGYLNVIGMNLLTDAPAEREYTAIYFAQPGLKDFVTNSVGELPNANFQNFQILTPIYKYNVVYDKNTDYGKGDGGYFVFTKGDKFLNPNPGTNPEPKPEPGSPSTPGSTINPGPNFISTGNPSDAFNPAVLSASVSTIAASQATMNEVFKYVFEHSDAFTQLPALDRYNQMNANNVALSTDFNTNLGRIQEDLGSLSYEYERNKALWVRPYTTFETMNLKNGPDVDAVNYGTIIGYDGDFRKMRNGWHRMGTSYIGYNGSQLNYAHNDTTLNGGLLGFTETYYKGNFWTAITASAGVSVGETHTMYGKEDYTSLLAGVASKTGYNFEYKEGRYIVQPIMFISYTFVNTFDYTNAAGVKIDSKPAHSIMLHPSVRVVMNCENGWQPYAQAGVVWNVMNKSHVSANGVVLPNMRMDPYAEYGIGVQRSWKEKFTAFGQAMLRNGGRTGIAFTAGFRWALGRDDDMPEKVYTPRVLKEAKL